MKRIAAIPGETYGAWTVIGDGPNTATGQARWYCRCRCGAERLLHAVAIRRGISTRCRRCAGIEVAPGFRHGECAKLTPELRSYYSMRSRAGKRPVYRNVRIAPEWIGSNGYKNFLAHLGRKPDPTYELDRIDPRGHYKPGNVRWVQRKAQMRNVTYNVVLTARGETHVLAAWAEIAGVSAGMIAKRLRRGWSVECAIFTPPHQRRAASSAGVH